MLVGWLGCRAQDVIVFANGESVAAIVTEIGGNEVKYKKASNPNGPTYTIERKDISHINFQNGETEYFTKKEAADTASKPIDVEPTVVQQENSAYSYVGSNDQNRVSDAALMKAYTLERAKKIKKRSIIGGSCLAGLGLAAFVGISIWTRSDDNWSDDSIAEHTMIGGVIGGALVVGGGVWILAGHHQAKQMIQSVDYVSLMECDLFSKGRNALSASVDFVKSNGFCKSNGLGLSLKYTF